MSRNITACRVEWQDLSLPIFHWCLAMIRKGKIPPPMIDEKDPEQPCWRHIHATLAATQEGIPALEEMTPGTWGEYDAERAVWERC